jgi:hypothetical protein
MRRASIVSRRFGRPSGLPDTPGLKLVDLSPPLGIAWFCLFWGLFPNVISPAIGQVVALRHCAPRLFKPASAIKQASARSTSHCEEFADHGPCPGEPRRGCSRRRTGIRWGVRHLASALAECRADAVDPIDELALCLVLNSPRLTTFRRAA